MKALSFLCPVSGERVETGIYADVDTLKQVLRGTMRVRCAACEQAHDIGVAELVRLAESGERKR